jgi:acetylornithine deacetylase/succinyl-diaminopimelate desuccinylase-like protein
VSLDYGEVSDDALRTLDSLCRLPSVSTEGRALEETAGLVEELLREAGFETCQLRVDGSPPAVFGEQQGRSDYRLLLYNHYDVQPADPIDLWESPPFEPTLRDGKLFARGAADNKGELAVRLAVTRALREQREGPPIGVRWIIEGEEEVLSPHFDEIVRQNVDSLRADACLWEGAPALSSDGRPTIGLGFKGSLAVRLEVRLLESDAHSAVAAVARSAPWRLVQALASLRDRDGVVRIRGFYDQVRGPTEAERWAIEEQSNSMEQDIRAVVGDEGLLEGVSGAAFRERVAFAPTCNIAGIEGGYTGPGMKSVLPAQASARIDLRLVPDQTPDNTLALLHEHLTKEGFEDIEVTVLGTADAAGTAIDHPFVRRVISVAERVSGAQASVIPRIGGSLPIIASLQRHLDTPGLSAPGNPFYFGAKVHAPNEHVRIEDVEQAVVFTSALLEELGRDA